jgi:hypothetical protein
LIGYNASVSYVYSGRSCTLVGEKAEGGYMAAKVWSKIADEIA